MKAGLRFPAESVTEEMHKSFNGLITTINSPNNPYQLKTANRIYTQQGKPFQDKFLHDTKTHYSAEAKKVDFVGRKE